VNLDESLLQSHDPPKGGLEGLRTQLKRRQYQQGIVAVALVAVLVLGWFDNFNRQSGTVAPDGLSHPLARLISTESVPAVRIVDGVAVEWPSSSSSTRIYLVDGMN
jgi:hypothetical protein